MKNENNHSVGKKLLVSGLALLTAAGLAISTLFQSPAELMPEDEPAAVVTVAQQDGVPDDDGDNGGDTEDSEEEKGRRGGLRRLLRERILAMPQILRVTVILPLWALGTGVIALVTPLWTALGSVASSLLSLLLTPALLLLCFLLAAKTIFPDLPLRKILNRKTLPWLLLTGVLIGAADGVLALTVEDYTPWRNYALSEGLLLSLAAFVGAFLHRIAKRESAQKTPAALPETHEKPLVFDAPGGSFQIGRKNS